MSDLESTRTSLHAIAELLLAGPQYVRSRSIRLRPSPGGFATVAPPDVRVLGTDLVLADRSIPLDGRRVADVASEAGLTPRRLNEVYADGSGLGEDHVLRIEADAARQIADGFQRGTQALAVFAPGTEQTLWPEHFDLAITLDEVNYGISPGDTHLAVPYAYVGPPSPRELDGTFWNAPFGAALPLTQVDDLEAFFSEGRSRAAG